MALGNSSTLFIGNQIIRLNEVGSTNSFALDLLRGPAFAEGAVVLALSQTNGRGQRENVWQSEPAQNVVCSIILKPTFLAIPMQFDLTRAISLGVSDLLIDLVPSADIHIKWPNDIIANGKKVAGILIENIITGSLISAAVVGIGLNVNQAHFDADLPHAISILQLTQKETDLDAFLQQLFRSIEARYLQLRACQFDKLRADYHARLYKLNCSAHFSDFKTDFDATIEGVSAEGFLILRSVDGVVKRFNFNELKMIF